MWPWDWISSAGNAISGLTQKAVDWVNSLIASVMSWVTDAINKIWHSISSVWDDITSVWNRLVGYINNLTDMAWRWVSNTARQIYDWALRLINDLWGYVKWLYNWAANELDHLYHLIWGWVQDVYNWVRREIWDPLYRLYNDVKNWFIQMFNRVWQYIEHPELLVKLIGGFLIRVWVDWVKQFGPMIVRWLIGNMRGLAGEVFDLLEHIISAVL